MSAPGWSEWERPRECPNSWAATWNTLVPGGEAGKESLCTRGVAPKGRSLPGTEAPLTFERRHGPDLAVVEVAVAAVDGEEGVGEGAPGAVEGVPVPVLARLEADVDVQLLGGVRPLSERQVGHRFPRLRKSSSPGAESRPWGGPSPRRGAGLGILGGSWSGGRWRLFRLVGGV